MNGDEPREAPSFDWGVSTDRGTVRAANEDALLARPLPRGQGKASGLLVAVADGMGGFGPGSLASNEALEVLGQELERTCQGIAFDCEPKTPLRSAVLAANRALHQAALEDGRRVGTGTTLAACWLLPECGYIAHVGDSRVYLFRDGDLRSLTVDHSLRQLLHRLGGEQVAANGAEGPPLRLLGTHPSVAVDVQAVELREGDRLLLATDGLTDAVSVETLANILALPRDTQWIARQLVASALEHGSKDNATAVVVQCCAQSASASDVWPPRPLRSARRPA